MRIPIANDDGIYSPGIAALARIATRFGTPRRLARRGALLRRTLDHLVAPTTAFSELERRVVRALETILGRDEPSLVNVNFPLRPRGMSWTRQAVDRYDGAVVPDLHAVANDLVFLTPLRLDLTDRGALAVAAQAAAR